MTSVPPDPAGAARAPRPETGPGHALDRRVPALVLKLDVNPFHHGALGIIRSLGRAGVPTYAVVEGTGSPAGRSRYLTGRFLWTPDLRDEAAVLAGLITIGEWIGDRPVLIPTDDFGAILVAEHAAELAPYFRFPAQPRDLPRRLASKKTLTEICRAAEVATPSGRAVTDRDDLVAAAPGLDYPTVVKLAEPWSPRDGEGIKSTTIVGSADELVELASRLPAGAGPTVLLQEYLPAEACEDWFFHGVVGEDDDGAAAFRLSVTGRKIRSWPPTAGITTLGRAWDNPDLRQVAERLLAHIGYRGIVDLDFRLDRRSGAYHLLDANPRVGAQFAVARRSDGVDAARALHRELTDLPLPPQQAQSRDHALCVENYDLASSVWSLLHRRLTPWAWRRSLRSGPVELAWSAPDDRRPAAHMWFRFALRLVRRGPVHAHHPAPVMPRR